jgi:signal peptidase I
VAIFSLALMLAIVLGRAVAFQPCFVPTSSMAPTLQKGDYLLLNTLIYRLGEPQRGDVVVFRAPPNADPDTRDFVKRVVGLPGDTLAVWNGRLFRNGQVVSEPYIKEYMDYTYPGPGSSFQVPAGQLFVLGDNRNISDDSHLWGPLPRANLLGKVFSIYWPKERAQWLK